MLATVRLIRRLLEATIIPKLLVLFAEFILLSSLPTAQYLRCDMAPCKGIRQPIPLPPINSEVVLLKSAVSSPTIGVLVYQHRGILMNKTWNDIGSIQPMKQLPATPNLFTTVEGIAAVY